jgi:predicted histidine transporter YuiF (NhaC family)
MPPFYPNFPSVFAQISGLYEGVILIPSLFSNSQNQLNVDSIIRSVIWTIGLTVMVLSPLGILTYGSHLQEIILMNLQFGEVQFYIKIVYTVVMVYNITMIFLPILEVI